MADTAAFQGWRFAPTAGLDTLGEANFRKLRSVTLDFGRHVTGHLVFRGDRSRDYGFADADLCPDPEPALAEKCGRMASSSSIVWYRTTDVGRAS